MASVINVVNLRQHYGIRPVVTKVTFSVEPGELVCVMGPNGSGKSTLLAAMAGILAPQKGHVAINGRKRRSSPEAELAIRKETVYLPADAWLPATMSCREFILAVGRLYEVEDERLMDHAGRLLTLFQLDEKADSPISACSTGQRKKVAICSALITEAPVMILDEPFSGGLDPSGLLALRTLLKRLADREDVTVVMATPVPELVEGLAHRILILRDGTIGAYDTPEGLRKQVGCDGPLEEVLEQLIDPQTLANLDRYFEEAPK